MQTDRRSRRLLIIGFGGLLLLLVFTGLDTISVLQHIQAENQRIREDYVQRNRILEDLAIEVNLSGVYARELLLQPDPSLADVHRKELETSQQHLASGVAIYTRMLRKEERAPFQEFVRELNPYLASLSPALHWNAEQRSRLGFAYMRDSILPRRVAIVQLAKQISQVNQELLRSGDKDVNQLFSNFRRQLITLLVLAFLCGLLLAGGSIHRLLRWERISALRLKEAEQARAVQRELSTRLLDVQEQERKALSRELHDEVGQALAGLVLGVGNVAATLPDGEARSQLHHLRRLGERTVAVVRDMSLLLRPSMLDDLGLVPALQWQAREASRTTHVSVEVHADSVSDELPDEHKTCVYRIVQEALRNVSRHAKARNVQIHLTAQEGRNLELRIEDDGRGFLKEREKGVGLLGMEERVLRLKGKFVLQTKPGGGTRIDVHLPLSNRVPA
jgi:signal transduction histidine kinase